MKLAHNDDGKGKWRSHEISIKREDKYDPETEIFGYDLYDITGYGANREEAIEDFKRKLGYFFEELKIIEEKFLNSEISDDDIIKVDCFGNEIK